MVSSWTDTEYQGARHVSVRVSRVSVSVTEGEDPMLLPSGNPFKCHEEVLYFQLLIPPKRFDIFSP